MEDLYSNEDLQDLLEPDPDGSRPRIYVQTSDKSPFGRAFRNFLITELITANFSLSDSDDAAICLSWETQLVERNKNRLQPYLPGVPAAVLAAAGTVLFGPGWSTSDFWVPHTELILTTRITIGKYIPEDFLTKIVGRGSYSKIYYINDGDWDNYQVANAFSRSIAGKEEAWKRRLAQQGLLSQ